MAAVFLLPLVVINEVAWMGTSVAGVEQNNWWRYEWVELYNNGDIVELLNGWTLELYRDTLDFRIPLEGAINPRGYFLVGASDKILNLDLNYTNLAGKFVNSGQKIVLKNRAGEIVDEIDARSGWPAGDNETKRTLERVQKGFQTSADVGGTPRGRNSSGFQKEKPPTSYGDRNIKLIDSNPFNSPVVPAFLLAGVSALVMVVLRRRFQKSDFLE